MRSTPRNSIDLGLGEIHAMGEDQSRTQNTEPVQLLGRQLFGRARVLAVAQPAEVMQRHHGSELLRDRVALLQQLRTTNCLRKRHRPSPYTPVQQPIALLDGKMYWAERVAGKIQRADLDGSNVEDLFTGITSPRGIAVLGAGCPADLNDDGTIDAGDVNQVLGAWGTNPRHPADLNGDGVVGAADLAIILGNWGPC